MDSLFTPGTLVDHFKVLRLLGQGGMGEVYLARDTKLGRKVALKRVRPKSIGTKEGIDRFLFEARITARFNHPHIVTIYAVGETDDGPYVALEYLEGRTLRERMKEGQPSLKESLRIGLAIAEALQEAHGHNILHRDLKPTNVLLPKDGRLRVLDFGLAKAISDQETGETPGSAQEEFSAEETKIQDPFVSRRKGIRGTPLYMAPEQWKEENCTSAADIWALGFILYELVTGIHPHKGLPVYRMFKKVCDPEPVPTAKTFPDVPQELAELIDACLEKDAKKRPIAVVVADKIRHLLADGHERVSDSKSPFRGLMPFGEQHADFFFGRGSEVASFLERIREEAVLPVVGPSGAGKTSFVQAGIIPRLREQDRWVVLTMRPGDQPFSALATQLIAESKATQGGTLPTKALSGMGIGRTEDPDEQEQQFADSEELLAWELYETPARLALVLGKMAEADHSRVLFFVDQLEELFTMVSEDVVRRQFMQALYAAADDPQGPVRVIFTLRDDFLGRAAEGEQAREVLSRLTVMQSPGPEALHEILAEPLKRVGYSYDDPKLVEEMISTVRGAPAALPLLQFACQMLWERRDKKRRLLSSEVYQEIGGVAGALAHHADAVLAGFSPSQVHLAKEIFLRLVTVEGMRCVVSRKELLDGLGEGADEILARLTLARLISARRSGKSSATEEPSTGEVAIED
ncbi:MAG: serine/threonine-protein kinase, partial [Pseudomonadota bacterium]